MKPLLTGCSVLGLLSVLCVLPTQAGDILRGGAPANQRNPALGNPSTSAAADAARTNARDALTRTTQAITAVQNMQNAAKLRAAAAGQDRLKPGLTPVTNGLSANGLNFSKVVPGADGKPGASDPSQTIADGRYNVTVKQTAQQAFLEWKKFNVSRSTTLYFDQSAGGANSGQWIAFNQVKDPSAEPSQIMGQIKAQGQVYILNANGILFGGTSQVNVHGLVASTLPLNPNLTSRGLLNNPDFQFLFSALPLSAGKSTPAFDPYPTTTLAADLPKDGRLGDVEVMAGAQLSAPTNADHVGGRIALLGANVTNAGRISTPDGQTILAAGLQVGFTAHASTDPSLRGLDVFVGAVQLPSGYTGLLTDKTAYAGTVTNTGWIDAPRGNITMTGKTLNQLGALTATTSVSLNGRIDLNASYNAVGIAPQTAADKGGFLYQSSGTVTLGPNSVTRIMPELSSTDKVVGTKLALPSQINMQGNVIHFDDNAMVLAPNADVSLKAGRWNYVSSGGTPSSAFVYTGGQVYLDKGAWINVAGTHDSSAPLTDNIVTLQLRGAEFANSSLNRNNANVRGVDITLDLRQQGVFNGFAWSGTPLADATGYVGLIQRDVGQLTGAGGNVNINAGGSVVIQQGAGIDVSGGFVNYGGGMVQTTRLTYGNHIFDISQATPDRVYDGVYTGQFTETSSRWGVTKTYTVPFMLGQHYEPGYVYGLNGGSINISAPTMALNGTLRGNTVNGPRQRDLQATPSSLALSFEAQKLVPTAAGGSTVAITHSPSAPSIVFQNGVTQAAANPFALDASGNPIALRDDRAKKVVLSPDALKESGFGSLAVKSVDGKISVPEETILDLGPRGSLTLSGANVDVQGSIVAPGGSVTLNAYNISPSVAAQLSDDRITVGPATPAANGNRGLITLGENASISTAGLIVDDRLSAPDPFTLPLSINGGSVTMNAFSANLAEGSLLDVSGGVRVDPFGKRTYGDAGSISVITGRDLSLPSVTGGRLTLDAALRGLAGIGARGGSLILQAMKVQIGGAEPKTNTLFLTPDFFNQGGFASFSLKGVGGLDIAPGTVIEPNVKSAVAVLYGDGRNTARMQEVELPQSMRSPVSLTFGASGIRDAFDGNQLVKIGAVTMGEGAVIKAGPLGSVAFDGETTSILGSVFAPGGMISLKGADAFPLGKGVTPATALSTVYVGPHSVLSTAGTVVLTPDAFGRRTGYVLPGGSISVSGNLVLERGAVLDVSGTSGDLDIAPAYLGLTSDGEQINGLLRVPATSGLTTPYFGLEVVRTHLESGGGSITLKGTEMLFTHATLRGNAGGPTAAGGTLSISSGRFYVNKSDALPSDTNLVVNQSGAGLPGTFFGAGSKGVGLAVKDGSGTVIPGMGYFAANDFNAGGFDSLTLGGNVKFKGNVTIKAPGSLQVATSGFLSADATVNLTAKYVALGTPFAAPLLPTQEQSPFLNGSIPYYFAPTFGAGKLVVSADLMDIGNLTLTGVGQAQLTSAHDIRGNGTFSMAGDLTMRASQIYPTTGSTFTIVAYDSPGRTGSITFQRNGTDSLPLSAGGTLNVYASTINQGGVLRAPFGVINLGWDGTGTAPANLAVGSLLTLPVTQQLTLSSGSITSVSAIDPITGQGILIPYGISPNGINWIDPSGVDITASGPPQKAIHLGGKSLTTESGSLIDLRGGGDVYAFRWVSGLQGTNDLLAGTNVFAVVPGYAANFAPYAAFNTAGVATNLNGNTGYVNGKLHVGDRVWLDSGSGLAAGYYTLLPGRYATMPGAFLVTPQSGTPIGTFLKPDGASYVNGYRVNAFDGARDPVLYGRFEVAPAATVAQRVQYDLFNANSFFADYATKHDLTVPRLPEDSGQLVFQATDAMTLNGKVLSASLSGGRGGLIDISSPVDIIIGTASTPVQTGKLVLNAAQLSSFGAESLLIGGIRTIGPNGTTVTVKTNRLTLQNDASSPLTGSDIILTAKTRLDVKEDSVLRQTGSLSGPADTLLLGDANVAGSGDGLLVRVSADPSAQIVRSGVTDASTVDNKGSLPRIDLRDGSLISGTSVIVDSTYATNYVVGAQILGQSISLNSGQISLELDGARAHTTIDRATDGLILTGADLQRFQSARSLSLLSYSSLDIYGTGTVGTSALSQLALHAGEIRGFDQGASGTVTFEANSITLDNSANGRVLGAIVPTRTGTIAFKADTLKIGANNLPISQYANLTLDASKALYLDGKGGLNMAGAVNIQTPVIVAGRSSVQSIIAGGALTMAGSGSSTVSGGLGANLTLQGTSVTANSNIQLPSGRLSIIATNGDINVGGKINVGGTAQTFYDVTKFTDAGTVTLTSKTGSVNLNAGSSLNLAAQSGGGDAGTLIVSAAQGDFTLAGTLNGKGGSGGRSGSFALDVKTLPSLAAISSTLNTAGFNDSRSFRVRTGDVLIDGVSNSHAFTLSTDSGKIDVSGTINTSGVTGGSINLVAFKGLNLLSGAKLDASATDFDSAGKGGTIELETRGGSSGTINIASGSTIDLHVNKTASLGQFSGTLHLRAPQNAGVTDLAVDAIQGSILGASIIVAEGFATYNLTGSGVITSTLRNDIFTNGTTFGGNATAIANRLLAGSSVLSVQVGAELISTGNITLGTVNPGLGSTAWDLSTFRFGTKQAPGVLTMRAAGDIVFYEALSDGFQSAAYDAKLLTNNALLSANAQSWSYRLTAGADLAAADVHQTNGAGTGSLLLGRNAGTGNESATNIGADGKTSVAVKDNFQVIRTGSGSIEINAGQDVRLLNQFATIYTAGTQVADPSLGDTFDTPNTSVSGSTGTLGTIQQTQAYPAQFSYAGGNVSISAGTDITHLTLNNSGRLIADSSRQLPINWLYRRGYVDPLSGKFGVGRNGDIASTAWWVDFSNFFEGVGALGGGHVTMNAGRDIANVDAVIPTNARMIGYRMELDSHGVLVKVAQAPSAANLTELGGGDLRITTGRNLDAGVYYVERGVGSIKASGSIITNSTRSPSLTNLTGTAPYPEQTWLPTTLFLGKSQFDVKASGDVLMGPAANAFLLPQGFNNSPWNKTWFSTYADDASVSISSLGGNVTLRESTTLSVLGQGGSLPILRAWFQNVLLFNANSQTAAFYQPWLRLAESKIDPFSTNLSLLPGTLRATSYGGDVNVVGGLTLSPSSKGTLELLAQHAVNGLQINGATTINGQTTAAWGSARINLSDANPDSMPRVVTPFAYQTDAGTVQSVAFATGDSFLQFVDQLFAESGKTTLSLQEKQSLHSGSLLHAGDTDPLRLYALGGDISGVTLFSSKAARVVASDDITDIALYIQNVQDKDVSVVASGRDIIAYDASSPLRTLASSTGNSLNLGEATLAGDIQISGPGTLEVLAGRNLDLGVGGNNTDGTGVGITSIGNGRNLALPFAGANIIAAAGIGPSFDLSSSKLDFDGFMNSLGTGATAGAGGHDYFAELGDPKVKTLADYKKLGTEEQKRIALALFFLVLRDAGRDHNLAGSPGFGNYTAGQNAVATLFKGSAWSGEITTQARDIRTKSGGDIVLLAPGGGLKLADSVIGTPLAPPGIITEGGGKINIFTDQNVDIGISRIFTLRGGDEVIWSSKGNIAAGSSSKTVQSAPPTRVLIDPQSGDVKTDLAGLATGGGIGVLATVAGVAPGSVDLIAPLGTIDAGDAGIRATGNLNIAAVSVLNASNISVGGSTAGAPAAPAVSAPNVGGLTSSSNTAAATNTTAQTQANKAAPQQAGSTAQTQELPSIITVEVIGYGGGEEDEEELKKKRKTE